jgi:ssDNA-binding Zn-finger/Zn-ribbon topoisomerase 1
MARSRGKIEVVCQNPRCRYYLKEKGKDIIKSGKYKSTGHQRYYCKHLVEKKGIRSIERITDIIEALLADC